MKLFGWKSAGRGMLRPAKTHVSLTRTFAGGVIGEWPRSYEAQLREGYLNNVVAQRAVRLVAEGVASVPLSASDEAALAMVKATSGGQSLLETLAAQLLLHGNGYVQLLTAPDGAVCELYALRPERVSVEADARGWPAAFRYKAGEAVTRLGANELIHIRSHHPLDDHYGLGCLGAASGAIAIHNASTRWNKALLDNAARPSGALVHEAAEALSGEQFDRLQEELKRSFSGQDNAGRPMLLEGGLKWQTLSLTPADMDFAGLKAAAAREIALAFGVPPMLLGLPGDATYANYREANKALWRQAILPLAGKILDALSEGLRPWFADMSLKVDVDQVAALSEDRERLWAQVAGADFLTVEEKRAAVGFDPVTEKGAFSKSEVENKTGILELKYNPWHDTEDGKFTFAGQGRNYGGSFGGGGATGSWDKPKPSGTSGGGRSGRGGASGGWKQPKPSEPKPRQTAKPRVIKRKLVPKVVPKKRPLIIPKAPPSKPLEVAKPKSTPTLPTRIDTTPERDNSSIVPGAAAAIAAAGVATAAAVTGAATAFATRVSTVNVVSSGGYKFSSDSQGRSGPAWGELRLQPNQKRSRGAQRNAGKPDRRASDHGGHLIAREFGGSEIPENHVAQDAKINRGIYRRLENKWKNALRRGNKVEVRIIPKYKGSSRRPDYLEVKYKINGKRFRKIVPNNRKGK